MSSANARKKKSKKAKQEKDRQSALLAEFSGITGDDNMGYARQMLEASNWKLESAVSLHYSGGSSSGVSSSTISPTNRSSGMSADVVAAAKLAGVPIPNLEPEYRAPIAAKRQRLADGFDVGYASSAMLGGYTQHKNAFKTNVSVNEPFRSYSREASITRNQQRQNRQVHHQQNSGLMTSQNTKHNGQHKKKDLASIFAAPIDIMTRGSFDYVISQAKIKNLWILVNIQSVEEFASHQLNRDTCT